MSNGSSDAASHAGIKLIAAKVDFPATLSVYSQMDGVGISLASDFPEWERSPLKIELRSKENHRTFKMAHNHCFFDSFWPENPQAEIELGVRTINQAITRFSVSTATRVGIQVVFAREEEIAYDDLVHRFDRKLHNPFSNVPAFDGHSLVDLSYVLTLKDSQEDQWTRNVVFCPMTRIQWFQFHPLAVRPKDLETKCIEEFKSTIPDVFSYVSIDASVTNVARNVAIASMEAVARKSIEVANRLHSYLHE